MIHDPPEANEFIVEESKETFDTWISRPYIPQDLRQTLLQANVLIVPREGFREYPLPIFPIGTEDFFNYLRENANKGFNVDICISDKDYKELALHSGLLIIGSIVVTAVICPIIADLIGEYIKRHWKTKQNMKVEIIVVEKDNRATRLLYEGSAKDFLIIVKPKLKELATLSKDRQKE